MGTIYSSKDKIKYKKKINVQNTLHHSNVDKNYMSKYYNII